MSIQGNRKSIPVRHGNSKKTIFVNCTDLASGQLVDAYVFVDKVPVGRTNRNITVDIDYSETSGVPAPFPILTISRQGFIDKEIELQLTIKR